MGGNGGGLLPPSAVVWLSTIAVRLFAFAAPLPIRNRRWTATLENNAMYQEKKQKAEKEKTTEVKTDKKEGALVEALYKKNTVT